MGPSRLSRPRVNGCSRWSSFLYAVERDLCGPLRRHGDSGVHPGGSAMPIRPISVVVDRAGSTSPARMSRSPLTGQRQQAACASPQPRSLPSPSHATARPGGRGVRLLARCGCRDTPAPTPRARWLRRCLAWPASRSTLRGRGGRRVYLHRVELLISRPRRTGASLEACAPSRRRRCGTRRQFLVVGCELTELRLRTLYRDARVACSARSCLSQGCGLGCQRSSAPSMCGAWLRPCNALPEQ